MSEKDGGVMFRALATFWTPEYPVQHAPSPHFPSEEDAQMWCETFAKTAQVKVESAVVYKEGRETLHGYYDRKTGTWQWERA